MAHTNRIILIFIACAICIDMCFSEEELIELDNRINLLQEQLNALKNNLDETIIIRPTARPCNSLGAPSNPALSCEQLKEACQAPSGDYFIQGGHATFYKVYCEMDAFGGGWTRFGKGNMSSIWSYVDETKQTVTLEMITALEMLKIKNLWFTEYRILTDVQFSLQHDDSVNPSRLYVDFLQDLSPAEMYIDGSADRTYIIFDESNERIVCEGSSSGNRCGEGGLPANGAQSNQLVIRSAFFGPKATGATAFNNQWFRNKYTWNGSHYYLLAK